MAMDRLTSSLRGAERRRRERFPQLPPPMGDYPVFPDTSAWPVARLAARPARISRRASNMASYCSIALLRPGSCHNSVALCSLSRQKDVSAASE